MLKNKSLFFKLSLSILAATSIVMGIVICYTYFNIRKIIFEDVEKNAQTLSESAAAKIDEVFISASQATDGLAFFMEHNSSISKEELEKVLADFVARNKAVYGSAVAFEPYKFDKKLKRFAPYCWKEKGKIETMNLDSDKYCYEIQDWYQIPREISKPVWSEPYFDDGAGGVIMSTYSVPFFRKGADGKKELMGVVTVDVSLFWLQNFINSLKVIKHGYSFIMSKHGTIVNYPDRSKIMHHTIFSLAEEADDSKLREVGREMMAGKSGFVPHHCLLYNKKCWFYYTPLASNGWSLGIMYPESELLAPVRKLNMVISAISVAGLGLIFFVIIIISHKITTPLRTLAKLTDIIGSGRFDCPIPEMKTGDEIGRLSRSFATMRRKIVEYIENLKETTAAKERIESELNIARDIQRSIIPVLFPAFPDRVEFEIYAILESAKAVGGDLYDFFFIDEEHLYFAIGDVSGKGVPASLFMAVSQTLSRAKASPDLSVGEIVTGINKDLCRDNEMSMFVTYASAILNIKTGKLEICNGGHNPPFMIRQSGEIEKLSMRHGVALGIMDIQEYSSSSLEMKPGDVIVLYTDGVTEAMDRNNNEYSEERLLSFLKKHAGEKDSETIVKELLADVKGFAGNAEQSDDITILVLSYRGLKGL